VSAGELLAGARVLSRAGLVDAFGHISVRSGDAALITPPRPLAGVTSADELRSLPLGELDALPDGVPLEAWIHWAAYRRDPAVQAVCRAQPPSALAVSEELPALHGQAALVGAPVPLFDDARLVRDRARGEQVAAALGDGAAVILRGNGAVTTGRSVGHAVARMALLERAARVYLAARDARPLRAAEVAAWQSSADELLDRYWAHLQADDDAERR
jgi:HCOMODA/2-hydroxy-3-carboxy-muconic semialdehyde decarboxylase